VAIQRRRQQEYVSTTAAAKQEVNTAGLLRHAHGRRDVESDPAQRQATRSSIDYPAIAAEARKRMRAVFRGLSDLPGYRPEALVSALDHGERKLLLQLAVDQVPAWLEDVKRELAIHRVVTED
jgi:hypothetical protein